MRLAPLAVLVACADPPPEPPKPLCGSPEQTERIAMVNIPPVDRVGRGPAVLFDNGSYIFVDAQCTYWVSSVRQPWDEVRTGALDADEAERLGKVLHLNVWDDFEGVWTGTAYDAGLSIFDDSLSAVGCKELCNAKGVPSAVEEMRDALPVVAEDLWNRGSAVTSNLRVIAISRGMEPFGGNYQMVDWPLSRPITDLVRSGTFVGYGEGILEDNMDSVRVLKELRASYLRGDHGPFPQTIPVSSGETIYELYMRDTLPFEDENGIVPLSVERPERY